MSRRKFIMTAATAPLIIPSLSWSTSSAANERITMAIIGMGMQSRRLLTHFLYRTQVLAICDVDTTRREDGVQRVNDFYSQNPSHGSAVCQGYNDYASILERDDIDAVCIATPDHWHAIITMDALAAGKDIYCEKPLTHNISEAVEVMKAVGQHGRILQTGSQQRGMREFRVACELARNGVIGELKRIECSFGDPPIPCDLPEEPMEPGLDWNLWLGPAPMRPYNSVLSPRGLHDHWVDWRDYKEYGGGMVTDWGTHHLDIAQWALGMDESGPIAALPPEKAGDKRGSRLVYENGVEVIHKNGFGVHMHGTEGEIKVHRGRFWLIRDGETVAKFTRPEDGGSLGSHLSMVEREFLSDAPVRLYRARGNHVANFLQSVNTREKPITPEEIGGRSAICALLMNLTYFHHQTIKWDPVQFAFLEGTGDPQWLTGSQRNFRATKYS